MITRSTPSRIATPVLKEIKRLANPFYSSNGLKPVIDQIKNKKIVMIGEASHGTHEFYEWRNSITKELIENHGFQFIAVEGDWPACDEINQFIQNNRGENIYDSLSAFKRWPTWMWANSETAHFIDSLRKRPEKVGFYGLDVYSLFDSIQKVTQILYQTDPELAKVAQKHYECFDPYFKDEKAYARSLFQDLEGCKEEVIDVLNRTLRARSDFNVIQNARIVANADSYYRSLIEGDDQSWNIRDHHMIETLDALFSHYGSHAKGIVWAHNTHVGDYRATQMLSEGHVNIGGLAREKYKKENVSLIGFGTYQGTVIASHAWDGPTEMLPIPHARFDSIEAECHQSVLQMGASRFFLIFDDASRVGPLAEVRGHRAIGVVYNPEEERRGNYVPTSLSKRYDVFIFIDETTAVEPYFVPLKKLSSLVGSNQFGLSKHVILD